MSQHGARRTWRGRAGLSAGAILAAVAACTAPGRVVLATSGGPPGVLPHASCGRTVTRVLNGQTLISAASQRTALGCFQAAARHCGPAGIAVNETGVDAGIDYVFILEPSGPACRVTEWTQYFSVSFPDSSRPVHATDCRLTAVTGVGVTVRCAGRKLLIPARVA